MAVERSVAVLLMLCCLDILVCGSHVRKLTSDDLENIERSTKRDFIAVFYDKLAIREAFPKFIREFEKSANVLKPFGVELAKVDCEEQKSVSYCSSKDKKLFIYRKGDPFVLEALDLSYVFNEDSIVSNILQTALGEHFRHISDKHSFEELLSEARGKKDVVLSYVRGLGLKEHRQLVEMVHFAKDKAIFALTTFAEFMRENGLSTGRNAAVHLFHCSKQKTDSTDKCHFTQFQGKLEKIPLIRFIQSQTLPKYVILPSDRTTVYDSLLTPIHRVFVFSREIFELQTLELEQMVDEFQGSVGVILVNVNDHKTMLSSFGLSEDTNFPTAAFIPAKTDENNMTYIELYPENAVVFTLNNLKNFIKPLVENPTEEYKRIAEASSLHKISYVEYDDAFKSAETNYLMTLDFLLAVFCPEDNEHCKAFSKTLRRMVRTFDRAGNSIITTAIVKTAHNKKRFEGESFPVIHLIKSNEDFLQYTGELEYNELMDFITTQTKMKKPVSLPPSLSDEVPILFPSEIREDSEEFIEDEEEYREATAGEEPDYDPDALPSEETEDDEISAVVQKAKPIAVPEGLVPALTDKTFDVIKNQNDVLVVDFFQPWDSRSKALLEPYVDAATHLSNLDVGNFAVKLARVNCFDWTDVCQKNNITVYPTIKMFRKGSDEVIYNGPFDSDHLSKAVLLLQPTVPLALNNKEEVEMFFDGRLPKLAKTATDIAVVGMFVDKNSNGELSANSGSFEFKVFEFAAEALHGKFILGYVTGETAKTLSAEYGLRLPSLLVFKRNDPYQPMDIFDGQLTIQSIVDFVLRSNIPSFGELTPTNLPLYLSQKKPILIVFRADSEDSVITPVMTKLARDKSLPSVFLCWMPVYSNNPKDVNAEILKSYTGSSEELPALVLVNHDKKTSHHFKKEVTKLAVKSWVEDILSGTLQPTGLFAKGEWKPLLEGYDFLRLIDEEEEEKERLRLKKQKIEEAINEGNDEEPDRPSPEPEEPEERKSSRLRRPEAKIKHRDEL